APFAARSVGEESVDRVVNRVDEGVDEEHARPLRGAEAEVLDVKGGGESFEQIDGDGRTEHADSVVKRLGAFWFHGCLSWNDVVLRIIKHPPRQRRAEAGDGGNKCSQAWVTRLDGRGGKDKFDKFANIYTHLL